MERILELSINAAKKRLELDILSYNENAIEFKFDYEVIDDLIFCIGYSKVINEFGDMGIYRMNCINVYEGVIFKDGNVTDYYSMYKVDDVISRTKGYFNYYNKKLNNI